MDGGEGGTLHRAGHRDLGKMKCDGSVMARDPSADLYQLEQEAGQRPIRHRFGQLDTAKEGGEVVGQRMQLQPHLVVAEPPA